MYTDKQKKGCTEYQTEKGMYYQIDRKINSMIDRHKKGCTLTDRKSGRIDRQTYIQNVLTERQKKDVVTNKYTFRMYVLIDRHQRDVCIQTDRKSDVLTVK